MRSVFHYQYISRQVHKRWAEIVMFALSIFFFSYYSFFALYTHQLYGTGFDLAFFSNVLWNTVHSFTPSSFLSYYFTGVTQFLGQHFSPIVLVLAPLFLLPKSVELLLLFQSLILISAVIPIYFLGKHFRLPKTLIIMVVFLYLIAPDLQSIILLNFHELAFFPVLFLGASYFYLARRYWLYWLFIILLIGTKENLTLLVAAMGFFWILYRKDFKIGSLTALLGLASFLAVTQSFIPAIGGQPYPYGFYFKEFGSGWLDIIKQSLTHPFLFLTQLFTPLQKLAVPIFQILIQPFSFILIPSAFILFIPAILEKLLTNIPYQWSVLGFQHNIIFIGPQVLLLLLAARLAYQKKHLVKKTRSVLLTCLKLKPVRLIIITYPLLFIVIIIWAFRLVFPFPTFASLQQLHFLTIYPPEIASQFEELISYIPNQTSVATSNYNTLAHLSARRYLTYLPNIGEAQYVLLIKSDRALFPELFAHIEAHSAFAPVFSNKQGTLYKLARALTAKEALLLRKMCNDDLSYASFFFPSSNCL